MTAAFSSALSSAQETSAATASPAVTPATEPTPAEPSAPAATTPAAAAPQTPESATTQATEPPAGEAPKGEPPAWRWQDILANARKTTAEDTEARIRQEYEWAKDIAAQERDGLLTWRRALNGDPQAIAHIKSNQQAVQWLKSLVAEPQAPAADPEPVVIGRNPDGTEYFDPDAFEQWKAWNARQTDKRLEEKLRPFQQVAQTFQQREAQSQADREVSQALSAFANDPDFTPENRKACATEIANDPRLQVLANRDPQAALELAWARVYKAKVLPAKQQSSEAAVVANLQQRAVASLPNPGAAVASQPKKFAQSEQGFAEALRHHAGVAG